MREPDIARRVPICMCLDISGSMSGHIDKLNEVARNFCSFVKEKSSSSPEIVAEISQVIFGGGVTPDEELIQKSNPQHENGNKPVFFQNQDVKIRENTPLGEALLKALNALEERTKTYKKLGVAYSAVLLLISDGQDNSNTNLLQAAQKRIFESVSKGKLIFIPVGLGEKINTSVLQKFTPTKKIFSPDEINFSELLPFFTR